MPDEELVEYIRQNKAQFGLEKLRKGLLSQGVSYSDIKEAINVVESEEQEKIAKFIDKEAAEVEELIDDEGRPRYQKVINNAFDTVSSTLGVGRKDKKLYLGIVKYGGAVFVFINIITTVFRYIAGRMIYPSVAANLGVYSKLALPDIFIIKINLWEVLPILLWSFILGAAVMMLFFRYIGKIWPFSIWPKASHKVFAFLLGFEVLFGIILNGLLTSFSGIYILGYIVVLVGTIIATYLSSGYLIGALETKHGESLRKILN